MAGHTSPPHSEHMTPQEIYEAKKLARLNELSLLYTGRPYSAPGEPKVKAPKAPSATTSKRPTLTKEQRKARKDRAVELLRQGELTQREIAEELGVTQTTVCAWAHEVGIKKRKTPKYRWSERSRQRQSERTKAIQAPSKERVQRFIELYESGAYVDDIAQELSIVRGTVYDWATRYKPNKEARLERVKKRPYKVTYDNDKRVRRVIELYEAGVPCSQIKAEVGVSVARIYRWCNLYADKDKRRQAKAEQRKVKAEQRKAQHVREAIEQRSARIKRVVELYEAGAHRAQIADEAGISIATVLKWGRQYGDKDKRRHANAEQRRQAEAEAAQRKREAEAEHRNKKIVDAVRRYERGELVELIAERHSVAYSTVTLWCSRYADKDKRRQAKAEQKKLDDRVQRFIELYESGAHRSQIAHEIGICIHTVYAWITRYQPNKEARYKHKQRIVKKRSYTVRYDNDERVRRVVELYESGAHRSQIAEAVGVHVSTAYLWAQRYADKDKRKQAKAEQRKHKER